MHGDNKPCESTTDHTCTTVMELVVRVPVLSLQIVFVPAALFMVKGATQELPQNRDDGQD